MYANDADHWIQKVTTIMCMCMRIYIYNYIYTEVVWIANCSHQYHDVDALLQIGVTVLFMMWVNAKQATISTTQYHWKCSK
jgi:hypothetical protein